MKKAPRRGAQALDGRSGACHKHSRVLSPLGSPGVGRRVVAGDRARPNGVQEVDSAGSGRIDEGAADPFGERGERSGGGGVRRGRLGSSDLVARLADVDAARREAALKELRALGDGESGLTTADGLFLLKAAAAPYPRRDPELNSTPVALILAVETHPDAAYIPTVRALFPDLDPHARSEALSLLGKIDDEAGARALLDLLEAAHAAGLAPEVSLEDLEREPKFGSVYFPRILKSARRASGPGILFPCASPTHGRAS